MFIVQCLHLIQATSAHSYRQDCTPTSSTQSCKSVLNVQVLCYIRYCMRLWDGKVLIYDCHRNLQLVSACCLSAIHLHATLLALSHAVKILYALVNGSSRTASSEACSPIQSRARLLLFWTELVAATTAWSQKG